MQTELIRKLHADFEAIVQTDIDSGTEFWCARDLQALLGYSRWENFFKVIEKAKTSCVTAGYIASNHFLDITKMVSVGSGANREVSDVAFLTDDVPSAVESCDSGLGLSSRYPAFVSWASC